MTKKKLLVIGLIISAIIGIFSIKTGGKKNTVDDTAVTDSGENQGDLGKNFISALFGFQNVNLDSSLTKSAVFKSLTPSGAFVDANPTKGRDDPFATLNQGFINNTDDGFGQSLRNFDLGQNEANAINSAEIKITKIASNNISISIAGMPAGTVPVVNLTSKLGAVSFADFTYKTATGEYSANITGLIPKNSYSITIISPAGYIVDPVVFETK